MAKPKGSEDVLSLLDSLGDSAASETTTTTTSAQAPTSTENETELLGFLDNLAKQPSRSQTPRPASTAAATTTRTSRDSARNTPVKKSIEKVVEKPGATEKTSATEVPIPSVKVESPPPEGASGGGWLGGLWNMGSAAMKTAEQKVKEFQETEEAKAWEERVRGNVSVLGKISILQLNSLTNTR